MEVDIRISSILTLQTGENPYSSLTLLGKTLFGMTYQGGANGDGLIFSIDTNGSGYKDLLDFDNAHGYYPNDSLTFSGKTLFGMASYGGANGDGLIFSIDTNRSGYKDLLDFNITNGKKHEGSLALSGKKCCLE